MLYYKFVELNKAVNVRHPIGSGRAPNPVESEGCEGERRRILRSDQRADNHKPGCGSGGIVGHAPAESSIGPG